jgi:hypothetical protein
VFAAFATALFAISRHSTEEEPDHPHILVVIEEAHRLGEISDEEFEQRKAEIEKEDQSRAA